MTKGELQAALLEIHELSLDASLSDADFRGQVRLRAGGLLAPSNIEPPGFVAWWAMVVNKTARGKLCEKWVRRGLERQADKILQHYRHMTMTTKWINGFVPGADRYLNAEDWNMPAEFWPPIPTQTESGGFLANPHTANEWPPEVRKKIEESRRKAIERSEQQRRRARGEG